MPAGKLLYVEDSQMVAEFLRDALSYEGVEAILAGHAAHALEILAQQADDIQLVLCDQTLPDASGLELMQEIRTRYPSLRLVLTTGFAGGEVEALAAAYDGLLLKPFEPRDVVALMA